MKLDSLNHPQTLLLYQRRKLLSKAMSILLGLMGVVTLLPLFSVLLYVLSHGLPGLKLSFFTELPKPVGEPGGGMANAILGTLTLMGFASSIGIPWGIAVGVYLAEYGQNRLGSCVRFCADLLSSTPSIIIGLFVYTLVVLPMERFSGYAGGLALGILMIPTLARGVEEILKLVPIHLREAGLALGLPRWKVLIQIILKGNLRPIATAVMLSIARVAGETAPLLFTSFNNRFWQRGLDQPIASLPVQIYNYAISPYPEWHEQAWTGALILVFMLLIMNLGTRRLLSITGEEHEVIQSEPSPILDVRELNAWFGTTHAVKGVALKASEQTVTAIIGPSGCGKSTFIRCLNRLHEETPNAHAAGQVLLEGKDIYASSVDPVLVRGKVGMVFQKPNPFPSMSIFDNVVAGLRLKGVRKKNVLSEVAEKSLKHAALWQEVKDKLGQPGQSLSGGQQQRLCIARALAVEPTVLLMDEPTSALDPISTAKIEELITELKKRVTIIIVTHNMQQAARISDKTAFFSFRRAR